MPMAGRSGRREVTGPKTGCDRAPPVQAGALPGLKGEAGFWGPFGPV
jgi:hypothetical protein